MLKRNTQILLGVFALLLVILLVLRNLPEDEAPPVENLPTQAVLPTLFDFAAEDVAGFRIESAEGGAVELVLEDDAWTMVEPAAPAEDVDQIRAAGLPPQLTLLRLVTENPLDSPLEALGLADPRHVLTIYLVDGETHVLEIGESSITNTGYYVSLDGGAPQLVTKSALDQFINLIETPPFVPTPIPAETLDSTAPITDTVPVTTTVPITGTETLESTAPITATKTLESTAPVTPEDGE